MQSAVHNRKHEIDFGPLASFLRHAGSRHASAMLMFSVLVNISALAPSFHMMQVYDRVLSARSEATLIAVTGIALFVLLVYALGEAVRGRISQRLSATYAVNVSRKMFARLGDPSVAKEGSSCIRDFAMARQFLASRSFVGFFDLPFVPVYLVLLMFVHPLIMVLTLLGIIVMTLAGYLNYSMTEQGRLASRQADAQVAGFAQSAFARSGEVQAMGMVPNLLTSWGREMAHALEVSDRAATLSSILYAIGKAIRQGIQVMTMAWGAWLVLEGDMSGGMIFLASMISSRALAPLEQIIGSWENIVRSVEAFNVVDQVTGPDKGLKRRPDLPAPTGVLQARDIVFRDFRGAPILAGVGIDLKPGIAVHIDGEPGSGKSIFLSILAGARKAEAGTVYLDGAPRDAWPQHQWGREIGYCGEEAGLLTGTVAQNIARFDPDADLNEIYRVTELLDLHQQIVTLPQGYQTMLNSTSDQLPASTRKSIALARAFYGAPKVLLLDQPTTFLDSKREGALLNALSQAKQKGSSIAVVSRSRALYRIYDVSAVIDNGRLKKAEPPANGTVRKTRVFESPTQEIRDNNARPNQNAEVA